MNNDKRYCVTYYSTSEDRFYTKKCLSRDELELFRNYIFRNKELEEIEAMELTLTKVGSSVIVYNMVKI